MYIFKIENIQDTVSEAGEVWLKTDAGMSSWESTQDADCWLIDSARLIKLTMETDYWIV